MTPFEWRPIGDPDPKRFAEARMQLLSVAQWLARVQRSYAEPSIGDDLSLRWSDERNAIATRLFAAEFRLELQIDDLVMRFTEQNRPSDHEIDVEERSPAHVEAWILIELLHRGVDRDRFSKDLPYDTSAMLSGDGVEFSPDAYGPELSELGAWFRNAVSAIRGAEPSADGVRISPRDLSVEGGRNGRALGFSPGDDEIPEPFFYVADPRYPGAGRRAVLRSSEIPQDGAAEAVRTFFAASGAATQH